jgi:sarcosine oxidase subunit beta
LESRWLVNAAGPFAAEIGRMLDVEVPVVPYRRNAAVTEAIEGLPPLIPMCVDLDTRLVTRREGPGCAIMFSNPDDPPSTSTAFDFDYLAQIAGRVGNRFPFLETAAIDTRKCWAGLYPETADRHAIIGPTPGHPRFLQCAGFCGHGIMQSLAAGQAIAELVTRGRCDTFDLRPLRLERFAEGDLTLELATL